MTEEEREEFIKQIIRVIDKERDKNSELLRSAEACVEANGKLLHKNFMLEIEKSKMQNKCNCIHGEFNTIGQAYFNCKLGLENCINCMEWKLKND